MERFENEFSEHLDNLKSEVTNAISEVKEIFEKKFIGKGDKEEILRKTGGRRYMGNIELLNAVIAACTSIIVVVLSQVLVNHNEKKRMQEEEMNRLLKEYINPIRFILAENYFRISKIVDETKSNNNDAIIKAADKVDTQYKSSKWLVGDGCYLISSCYLLACLFAYVENIRKDIPFLNLSGEKDIEIMRMINKLTAGFSKNLNIFYVIQMNIGKEVYLKEEQRTLTYREFCDLIKKEENLIWFDALIKYFIRIANGEYHETEYILMDIKEMTRYLDDMVLGGDSIEQKMDAEREVMERK